MADGMRDPAAVIQHLVTHAARKPYLRGKLRSGGLLDAELALDANELRLSGN
jgi:hypothetical protein